MKDRALHTRNGFHPGWLAVFLAGRIVVGSLANDALPATSHSLSVNESLAPNEKLVSADGRYKVIFQESDKNLVLYGPEGALWASGGGAGEILTLRADGNLVRSNASGGVEWQSSTAGTGAVRLTVGDGEGVLALHDADGRVVWTFYAPNGDVPGALTADRSRGEWTLLVVPDTQGYAEDWTPNYPYAHMVAGFQWSQDIAQQLNLLVVQGLGDIVESNNSEEWSRGAAAWVPLIANPNIVAIPGQGNHDDASWLNDTFPLSMFSNEPWWGGHFGGVENCYQLMTIGRQDYLFMTLEDKAGQAAVDWAKDVLERYPDRIVILSSHITIEGTRIHDQILSRYPQVRLSNCGHLCVRERYFPTNNGETHNFLTDYQCDQPGIFLLRFYTFKPMENKVEYYTYSPVTREFERDSSSQGWFPLVQDAGVEPPSRPSNP